MHALLYHFPSSPDIFPVGPRDHIGNNCYQSEMHAVLLFLRKGRTTHLNIQSQVGCRWDSTIVPLLGATSRQISYIDLALLGCTGSQWCQCSNVGFYCSVSACEEARCYQWRKRPFSYGENRNGKCFFDHSEHGVGKNSVFSPQPWNLWRCVAWC